MQCRGCGVWIFQLCLISVSWFWNGGASLATACDEFYSGQAHTSLLMLPQDFSVGLLLLRFVSLLLGHAADDSDLRDPDYADSGSILNLL